MFTADELRRQKRLGLEEINENVLDGLVEQRAQLEGQQNNIIRSLTISLFLAFVAWSGGNIKIPGTGASIDEVPAFLEISLITAAFCVLMVTSTFLSLQMYNAVIAAVASDVLGKSKLDPDLFSAARVPTWLFFKYCKEAPVDGRIPGFKVSKGGKVFYGVLVGFTTVVLLALWFLAISSILYIAHSGLSDSVAGWTVYVTCIAIIFASLLCMAANVVEFTNEMDFSVLEEIDSDGDA